MSRRPLGAQLPPNQRLVALETRIRAFQEVADDVGMAVLAAVYEGVTVNGREIPLDTAIGMLLEANDRLQDLRTSPIRGYVKRPSATDGPGRRP